MSSSSDRWDEIRGLAGEILAGGDPVVISVTVAKAETPPARKPQSRRQDKEPVPAVITRPTWTSDFQRLDWPGEGRGRFFFTPIQAEVIKLLLDALRRGCPWCDQRWLLRQIGSTAHRLVDVFRRSRAWTDLLIGDGTGKYRLPDWPVEDLDNIPLD